jgi:hypothetical protein
MRARRSRIGRLFALALLCLLLAPGTWWRETARELDERNILSYRRLTVAAPAAWPASLRLVGVWELKSLNTRFGGYSALLALPDGRLAAYSDRGSYLEFSAPGGPADEPKIAPIPHIPVPLLRNDIESAALDPDSGVRWLGLETNNAIARLAPGRRPEFVLPPLMRSWPRNRGAEAMVRLADGRFVVLAEGPVSLSRQAGPAVLFSGDPLEEDTTAAHFYFVPPPRFHPTDMAALPDGRVLILLRGIAVGLPPFRATLVVADPNEVRAGKEWKWRPFADLSPPLPRDNYEGLATVAHPDGGADIWIISDDNNTTLQRTLLIRLHWAGEQGMQKGAAGSPGAP